MGEVGGDQGARFVLAVCVCVCLGTTIIELEFEVKNVSNDMVRETDGENDGILSVLAFALVFVLVLVFVCACLCLGCGCVVCCSF